MCIDVLCSTFVSSRLLAAIVLVDAWAPKVAIRWHPDHCVRCSPIDVSVVGRALLLYGCLPTTRRRLGSDVLLDSRSLYLSLAPVCEMYSFVL